MKIFILNYAFLIAATSFRYDCQRALTNLLTDQYNVPDGFSQSLYNTWRVIFAQIEEVEDLAETGTATARIEKWQILALILATDPPLSSFNI